MSTTTKRPHRYAADQPAHRVGERKTINGVTYELNENHRWTLPHGVDPETAHGQKPSQPVGKPAPQPQAQPKKPAKPDDLHTAAKAQFGTVEHPHIRSIMQAMHTKGHSGQSALHDGPGQAAYDYLKANIGKQTGGGHVRDLGNGKLGISTTAGALTVEPVASPAAGGPKWKASYTTQTKPVADAGGYEHQRIEPSALGRAASEAKAFVGEAGRQVSDAIRTTPRDVKELAGKAATALGIDPAKQAAIASGAKSLASGAKAFAGKAASAASRAASAAASSVGLGQKHTPPPRLAPTLPPAAQQQAPTTPTAIPIAQPLSPLDDAKFRHDQAEAASHQAGDAHKQALADLDHKRYMVGYHQARGNKLAAQHANHDRTVSEYNERQARHAHTEAKRAHVDAKRTLTDAQKTHSNAAKAAAKAASKPPKPPPAPMKAPPVVAPQDDEIELELDEKAPHEQTRQEFEAAGNKAIDHKPTLKAAIRAGKTIPPHVLADYPELGGNRDHAAAPSPSTPAATGGLSDADKAALRAQGFTDEHIAKMRVAGKTGFHDFKPKPAADSEGAQLPAANPPAWSNTHTPEPWQVSRGDHHRASKDLPGYDPQAVSREHKQAVSDAIDAGHDVPPEAVEDYPDLRAALAQRKNAEASKPKPKPKPSDTQRPSDTPDPMGQNAIPGPKKPIAPPSGLTPEELQAHHQQAHDAAGADLDEARAFHAYHKALGNKSEAAKARADIAQHEYTQRHHKGELAKLKRQQKPAPQAKAPRVPTHTPQSLAANAGGFLLTHGLRDSDDNKRALAKAIASGQLDHPSKIEAVLRAAKERHQAGDVSVDDKWALQKAIDHHGNRSEGAKGAHDWKNDVRKLAEEGGHDPQALMDMVEDTHAAALEKHADREAAKKALRERAGLNSGDVDSSKYPDPASVPGFDQLAHDFAADHPDLGINPDDAEEAVWELLKEGQIPLPTRADVLDEAVQRLSSHKPMTAEERAELEATPFAKEGSAEKYRRALAVQIATQIVEQYAKHKAAAGQASLWDEEKHPRGQPDNAGEFAAKPAAKTADSAGDAAKQGARRTKNAVHFEKPIVGPSGAGLHSYEWKYQWEDNPEYDEPRRVSDWNEAERNEHTGRDVVHQFHVIDDKGSHHTASLETALRLLGFDKGEAGTAKVKNLASAAMQLAEHQQRHDAIKDDAKTPEWTKRDSANRLDDLKERVSQLTKEAHRAAGGQNPVEHYRSVAKKAIALRDLFHTDLRGNRWQSDKVQDITKHSIPHWGDGTQQAAYEEGKKVYRELVLSSRHNMLGERTDKTPIPEDVPATQRFGTPIKAVPKWSDAKMRNWYFAHGEDTEKAIEAAEKWLAKHHPGYKADQYARHRPAAGQGAFAFDSAKHPDPGAFVASHGYDGAVVGDEVVKYPKPQPSID